MKKKQETVDEFERIALVRNSGVSKDSVVMGIGDDCAVLEKNETEYTLASCDLLTEGVHFIREMIKPEELGYKAVAVNLSDIAAMGGIPEQILISVAVPKSYPIQEWKALYRGIDEICRKYDVALVGGDTTSSTGPVMINVTVLGRVEKDRIHYRRDAETGDVVFVTGSLGASKAGLELLLGSDDACKEDERLYLRNKHFRPEPRCREVRILNQIAGDSLHALNDISDGLFSESREIAEASGHRLVIYKKMVPVDPLCAKVATQKKEDGFLWAVTGGEDFELLGTLDASDAERIQQTYEQETGRPLYFIGSVTEGTGVFLSDDTGLHAVHQFGFNHFNQND